MIESHLFDGEEFLLKEEEGSSNQHISNEEINAKYRKGEMRIVTEQGRINLDSILNLLESEQNGKKKYILNPEYQRRKRWSNRQKSLLIESFIINVPIPPIFLYEVEYAVYEVMDGLQRLTAIYDFYKEKFALEGLEYWQELEGRTYSQLPENVRAGIDRRYLSSIILLEETAKNKQEAEDLKQIVFERLNSGGEKLTPQETRNALYNGDFNQMCLKLAKNRQFREMWNFPQEEEVESLILLSEDALKATDYSVKDIKSYRSMADVELILRFFAYRNLDKMTSSMDKFLDKYLKQANKFAPETTKKLEHLFKETIDLVFEILGKESFYLPQREGGKKHKSPAKTIYDAMMQAFSKNIAYKKLLLDKKEEIRGSLYSDNSKLFRKDNKDTYLFDGKYNNRKDVKARIEYFESILQKYIPQN